MPEKYSLQQMDQLLQSLLSSPEAIDKFANTLKAGVRTDDEAAFFATDPYDRLTQAVENAIGTEYHEVAQSAEWQNPARTAGVGAFVLCGALKGMGSVYATEATAPQELRIVCANVRRVASHVTGLAYGDDATGAVNMYALISGKDANDRWARPLAYGRRVFTTSVDAYKKGVSRSSLSVDTDEMGQLHIDVRYPRRLPPQSNNRRCPATGVLIETAKGVRPATTVFSRVIGAVAATEIYPRLVRIIDTPASQD